MTSKEIQERLNKAVENVEKRKATIERQKKQLEKKIEVATKLGCDVETETARTYAGRGNDDKYWAMCEVSDKEEAIKESYKKLEDLERIAENWKDKLQKETAKENQIKNVIPEVFNQLRESLVTEWDRFDKERKDRLHKRYQELGYAEFIKQYTYAGYRMVYETTYEQIHKDNVKSAENVILDLYNRVFKITGEVTDWSGIHATTGNGGFVVLNGFVKGVNGKAVVESILAGGYNIQRLHIRTLVKSI